MAQQHRFRRTALLAAVNAQQRRKLIVEALCESLRSTTRQSQTATTAIIRATARIDSREGQSPRLTHLPL